MLVDPQTIANSYIHDYEDVDGQPYRLASPPVRHPCFYGIDMPTKAELIASNRTPDEIAAYLGVDSLGYLSSEGMLDTVSDAGSFCTACFSGDYRAPLVDQERGYAMSSHC